MKKFITINDGINELMSVAKKLEEETINLEDSLGRVNSRDIISNINMPNFRKSPFDGYAVKSVSTKDASNKTPVKLNVVGVIPAGNFPDKIRDDGVYKIMTGALVPEIFDAVLKKEDTDEGSDVVEVYKEVAVGENVIRVGEDVKKGELILESGNFINPGTIGMLSSLGINRLGVFKVPRVALITTGDEVINVGEKLGLGQVYNSNRYALEATLKTLGADVSYYGIGTDNIDDLKERFTLALSENDVLITTGGVSVGDFDFIHDVYDELGIEKLFWGIQMKPGTPVLAGLVDDKVVLSLPGSPAASLIAFEVLGEPLIRKIKGLKEYMKIKHYGIMEDDFKRQRDMSRVLRVRVTGDASGYRVYLSGKQNASVLHSLVEYNALAIADKSDELLKKGDVVEFYFTNEDRL